MATENVGIFIDSKADLKGFKQAETAATKLSKTVKGLAATLGIAYGTKAVVNFGKAAAKAFIDDQKEADRLANAVKNLGLQFANPAIAQYIESLSKATAVTDSELRPAFQALLTTTGSLTQSQKLLSQAIDISAGSGVDLQTVAQDLANGYVGITKGLKKYNLGLTQAELKTMSFTDLTKKLNDQYKGANAAYLQTYAGKITAIGTAAGEAKEKIGGALIDSAMLISGSASIDDLITKMDKLASITVGWIDKFSEGLAIIRAIKDSNIGNMAENIQKVQVEAYNQKLRRTYMDAWKGVDIPKTATQIAAEKKAEAAAKKRAADLLKAQNKNTAELKKQATLKKAQGVFDLEQIQLVAALKGKLSDDEKLRVEAQLALLNGNVDLAKKLTDQILAAQDSTGNLSKFLSALPNARNPFEYLDAYLSYLAGKAAAIITGQTAPSSPSASAVQPAIPSTNVPSNPSDGMISYNTMTGLSYNPNANQPVINVTVQGNVIKEQELIQQIQNGTQLASLSGSPSQIGRIAGMFG